MLTGASVPLLLKLPIRAQVFLDCFVFERKFFSDEGVFIAEYKRQMVVLFVKQSSETLCLTIIVATIREKLKRVES